MNVIACLMTRWPVLATMAGLMICLHAPSLQAAATPATPATPLRFPLDKRIRPPAPPAWAADLTVLPRILYTDDSLHVTERQVTPTLMIAAWTTHVARQVGRRYEAQYQELVDHPQRIEPFKQRIRQVFLDQIGGLPTPAEAGDLNPVVTRTLEYDDHRIEFLHFQSLPGVYNTAMLYLPKSPPPYPAVAMACGHVPLGKSGPTYQRACKLLARNGIAALMYDPFEQGERTAVGSIGHTLLHVQSMPLGRAAARTWVWDGMRAIDYLMTRPDIIHDRIGAAGNSGGGTGSSYVGALDPRVLAVAPGCFISSYQAMTRHIHATDGEQVIPSGPARGLHLREYLIMRSPRPSMILAAIHDDDFPIDGARDTFQRVRKIYELEGAGDRMGITEGNHPHGLMPPLRAGLVQWMRRWLLDRTDPIIPEPPDDQNPVLSWKQVQVLPEGSVWKLPHARSIFDDNNDYAKRLASQRAQYLGRTPRYQVMNQVRRLAGIRRLEDIRPPEVIDAGRTTRWGFQVRKLILKPQRDIHLPVNLYMPAQLTGQGWIYLHQDGKWTDAGDDGAIRRLVEQGHLVMAVDLRGMGETLPPRSIVPQVTECVGHGDRYMLWLSALNVCVLGTRAEDILTSARFLKQQEGISQVHVMSIGRTGPAALHALVLEPNLVAHVTLRNSLTSWSDVVAAGPRARHQLPNIVFDALKWYDLPDLVQSIPANRLTIIDPWDATEKPLKPK